MSKIKLENLVALFQFLDGYRNDSSVPIQLAYKNVRLCQLIENDIQFFREKYTEIFNKYCDKEDNKKIKPENIEAYNIDMTELLSIEVDCPSIKFKLDELKDLKMSMTQLTPLMPFIEE